MNGNTHQLLLRADRLNEWECPSDASGVTWNDIELLIPRLEAITGRKLDVDMNVQDASFLTDIGLLDDRWYDRKTKTGALSYLFAFRFSNFSKLFTLHGVEWEERSIDFDLPACIETITEGGFAYIHAEDLEATYDGLNDANGMIVNHRPTWWWRFFDYL